MRIMLTGSPGTGKTTIAKILGKKLKYKVVSEKEFALAHGIGMWNSEVDELFVPLRKLQKTLNLMLEKEENVIVEGHMLCETKLKVDAVVVLRVDPEILQIRLELRGYRPAKIMDNVFCEGIDYCKKHAAKRYPAKKIIEIRARKTIKETTANIITELKTKGKL